MYRTYDEEELVKLNKKFSVLTDPTYLARRSFIIKAIEDIGNFHHIKIEKVDQKFADNTFRYSYYGSNTHYYEYYSMKNLTKEIKYYYGIDIIDGFISDGICKNVFMKWYPYTIILEQSFKIPYTLIAPLFLRALTIKQYGLDVKIPKTDYDFNGGGYYDYNRERVRLKLFYEEHGLFNRYENKFGLHDEEYDTVKNLVSRRNGSTLYYMLYKTIYNLSKGLSEIKI